MRKTLVTIAVSAALLMPFVAFAAVPTVDNINEGDGITLSTIETLIGDVFDTFARIAAVFVVGGIIYAGFLMTTSGGDGKRYEEGKKILYQVIVAAVVIFGVGLIVNTIANFAENPADVIQQ